jgi:hypothetical protein
MANAGARDVDIGACEGGCKGKRHKRGCRERRAANADAAAQSAEVGLRDADAGPRERRRRGTLAWARRRSRTRADVTERDADVRRERSMRTSAAAPDALARQPARVRPVRPEASGERDLSDPVNPEPIKRTASGSEKRKGRKEL